MKNRRNFLVLTYLKLNWKTPGLQFNYSLDRRLFVTNKTENRVRHYTVDHSKPKSDPNLSSLLLVVWRDGIHLWSRTPQTHLPGPFGLRVALPFPPDETEGREGEGKPRIRFTLAGRVLPHVDKVPLLSTPVCLPSRKGLFSFVWCVYAQD